MGPADKNESCFLPYSSAFSLTPVHSAGGTAAPVLTVRAGPQEARESQSR